MLQALNHSRPPSYRSHVSDHPVIESATGTTNAGVTQPLNNNNNTANHQTLSSTSSNNHNLNNNLRNHTTSTTLAAQHEQVQVAEVYAAPGSPESSQSVVVLNNSRINSNNPAGVPNISNNNQRSPGHISREIVGGQDISIVPVVSSHHHRHDSVVFEGKTDLQEQYQYHVKSGNPADHSSSKPSAENGTELPGLYNHLFTTTQENQEKPSMVTIVQTSVTNSEPVIVTVSGSMEQGLNATSSDSGSDFSELRASPAEVQILATL